MKTLVLTALVIVFGAQFAFADTETECHQCHKTETSAVRIVRELR